jgi:WD40 repeat protein
VQLSADGSVALISPDRRPATLRRVADGARLLALPSAFNAALDPTGRRAVVAQVDGQVNLLSLEAPPVSLLGRGTPATAVGFSGDGDQVVAGQLDGNIQVWRSIDGAPLGQLRGSSGSSLRLAVSPDGRQLVSGHGDGAVRVWALPEQPLRLPLTAGGTYPFEATGFDFSPDGSTVLTASRDGRARMWDAHTGLEKPADNRCQVVPVGPHCLARDTLLEQIGALTNAAYSPDGQLIATSSASGSVLVWDPTTAEEVARVPRIRASVDDLAFGPDSRQLATADAQGTVRIVEARTGRVRSELRPENGHGRVYTVTYTPGGDAVLAGGEDGVVREWNLAAAQPVARDLSHLGGGVFDLAMDRDGRFIAAGTETGIVLLDAADGHRLRTLVGHRGIVTRVEYSPDGALLFSGGQDGTVRAWDIGTGNTVAVFTVPGGDVRDIDVDGTGRRIGAAAAGGDAYVFDCEICILPDELARLASRRATRSLTAEEQATFAVR